MNDSSNCKVFVGNIGEDVRSSELKEEFQKFGSISDVHISTGFAFVSFCHPEDATDAIKNMDGVKFKGDKLRVEMSRGRVIASQDSRERSGPGPSGSRGSFRGHSDKAGSFRGRPDRGSSFRGRSDRGSSFRGRSERGSFRGGSDRGSSFRGGSNRGSFRGSRSERGGSSLRGARNRSRSPRMSYRSPPRDSYDRGPGYSRGTARGSGGSGRGRGSRDDYYYDRSAQNYHQSASFGRSPDDRGDYHRNSPSPTFMRAPGGYQDRARDHYDTSPGQGRYYDESRGPPRDRSYGQRSQGSPSRRPDYYSADRNPPPARFRSLTPPPRYHPPSTFYERDPGPQSYGDRMQEERIFRDDYRERRNELNLRDGMGGYRGGSQSRGRGRRDPPDNYESRRERSFRVEESRENYRPVGGRGRDDRGFREREGGFRGRRDVEGRGRGRGRGSRGAPRGRDFGFDDHGRHRSRSPMLRYN